MAEMDSTTDGNTEIADAIFHIITTVKILITKKGKRVAVILPIEEFNKVQENGLIGAKGALADLDETVDQMLGTIYESRESEKSREVKL